MVQLLQDLADEFADFAQGMGRGNPLLRMNVRKHTTLILRASAHLNSSRRIRGELNHHSFSKRLGLGRYQWGSCNAIKFSGVGRLWLMQLGTACVAEPGAHAIC